MPRALPGNRWDLLDGVNPPDPYKVSVVVAHYRQPCQLARTLRALRGQDHPRHDLEIIVADDGSPESPDVGDDVILVRQEDAGFRLAAARNLGARAATGDVLVFLDADTTPERSFIREITRLPALASDCVTVGRRRHADLSGAEADEDIARAVAGRELEDPQWLAEAYRRTRDLRDADAGSFRYLIGAVLACSREFFDEVGGFDETFTAYGGEDWDWAYRAWTHGAVLAHVPSAVAWHDGPDAGGRPDMREAKNAEAIRLASLIPGPGIRSRGLRPAKAEIAVVMRGGCSPAERFVSLDSVLAALPQAEPLEETPDGSPDAPFDRLGILVEILRPVRVGAGALAVHADALRGGSVGEITIVDESGQALIRLVSCRARARERRWGREDLFTRERIASTDIRPLGDAVSVEAYLGGWA